MNILSTPRSRDDREGLSSGISQRSSFALRRAASVNSFALLPAPGASGDESGARKPRFSELVPRKNSELDAGYAPPSPAAYAWWRYTERAPTPCLARAALLAILALLCLPATLTALHDAELLHPQSQHGAGLLDFSVQHLRVAHLRSNKALGGLSHSSNFGCVASAVTSRRLVLCDPTRDSDLACSLAAVLGAPYLAVSPAQLHQQAARFFQVIAALPHLESVVCVGDSRAYEATGTLQQLFLRFPRIAVGAIEVGGEETPQPSVSMRWLPHESGLQAPGGSHHAGLGGELPLPLLVGAPDALTFRSHANRRLEQCVAVLLPSSVDTPGLVEATFELVERLGAVAGGRFEVVVVAPFSLAALVALQRGRSKALDGAPVPAAATPGDDPTMKVLQLLRWVQLSPSSARGRVDAWRALHSLDAMVLPRLEFPAATDAVVVLMALALGTPVMAPASAVLHPDMVAAGVSPYHSESTGEDAAPQAAGATPQSASDSLERSLTAALGGPLQQLSPAPFLVSSTAGVATARDDTRRKYDAWYTTALLDWRAAVEGMPGEPRGSRGPASGTGVDEAGVRSDALHPAPAAAASTGIALYASELAPVSRGGAGVVTTAVAMELLCGGVDVTVIAPMSCSALREWRLFALASAASSCPGSSGNLTTLCVDELLHSRAQNTGVGMPSPPDAATLAVPPPNWWGSEALPAGAANTWATSPFLWPWGYAPSIQWAARPGADGRAGQALTVDFLVAESDTGFKSEDLAAAAVAASAVAQAYLIKPFAAVEFFDFFGPAFLVLARRVAAAASGSSGSNPTSSTQVLPPPVRVLIRAHGTMEAINEIEQPGPTHTFNRARHLMERFSLAAADGVLLQTQPVLEQYVRAYGIEGRRAVLAPPPVARIMALFHQQQRRREGPGRVGADTAALLGASDTPGSRSHGVCSAEQLAGFPTPCAGRSGNATAGACAVFLSIGKLQRIKGPLVLAAAFAQLLSSLGEAATTATQETHFVMVGGDADCDYAGGGSGRRKPMSSCVTALLPAAQRRWLHLVSALPMPCVDAAIAALGPVAVVFGSEFETFHLAAHEMAALQLPVILPDLPVYSPLFSDGAVYRYAVGDADALARVMAGVLQDWRSGRPLRRAGSVDYGDAMQPYRSLLAWAVGGPALQEGSSSKRVGASFQDALDAPSPVPPQALRDATAAALWHLETAFSDVCNGRN